MGHTGGRLVVANEYRRQMLRNGYSCLLGVMVTEVMQVVNVCYASITRFLGGHGLVSIVALGLTVLAG